MDSLVFCSSWVTWLALMMSLAAFLKSEIVEAKEFCLGAVGDSVAALFVATLGALFRPRTKCGLIERA